VRFSIIVPVYNCADALMGCIESVLCQSFSDFELLLIDDGSTDNSADICASIAQADSRVKIVYQANAGTSAARNTGLQLARGEFAAFLDNDDVWLCHNVLEMINNRICEKPSDIICFRTIERHEDGSLVSTKSQNVTSPTLTGEYFEDTHRLIKTSAYTPAVWSKAIRLNMIREHGILFPSGMRNEDIDFSCKLLRYAQSIDFIDELFYGWTRGRAQSQTSQSVTPQIAHDLASIIIANAEYASKLSPRRKTTIDEFLSYPFAVWMTYSRACDKRDIDAQWNALKEYSYVLFADGDCRGEMVRKTARVIGITATQWIAGRIAGLRN